MNKFIKMIAKIFNIANEEASGPIPASGPDRLEKAKGPFKPGETYLATVREVRAECVAVVMPTGAGCGFVSTKYWGKGEARAKALAALKPGDALEVVVKSFDDRNKTLTLVLKGGKMKAPTPVQAKKCQKPKAKRPAKAKRPTKAQEKARSVRSETVARKSSYRPLPKGTTILLDTANLIGKFGAEHAAKRLTLLVSALEALGYNTRLFWEGRALFWTEKSQLNAEDVAALKAFVRRKIVSIVGEESDLAMLQMANQIPNSVIVTRDHLFDYAEVYPEIVGTARHRSFSTAEVDGRIMLTIFGLKDAIVLPVADEPVEEESVAKPKEDEWALELDADVLERRAVRPTVSKSRHGLLGAADGCIHHGDVRRGLALLGRVARKLPKIYRDMAEVFCESEPSEDAARTAMRYDRLADRREKAQRERKRRNCRLRAERFRDAVCRESWSTAA